MGKVFCIDVSRCSGCYNCQFACKDEHCGNEWLPFSREQPLTGQFWLKMDEHVCGSRPRIRIYYMPLMCNHCDDPACMKAAKNGAVYKRDDGLVVIDPEKAAGQKKIADACPYGAVYWNEELNIPQKCTGCAHLLEEGKAPRCVDNCRTGALQFGDEEEFADIIKESVVLYPEYGSMPRVYYRNIPGQFIAGCVYDPVEEAVIREARCTLFGEGREERYESTDTFGDFWFRDLPVSSFSLRIEADGFKAVTINDISTETCINLGDIPMEYEQRN